MSPVPEPECPLMLHMGSVPHYIWFIFSPSPVGAYFWPQPILESHPFLQNYSRVNYIALLPSHPDTPWTDGIPRTMLRENSGGGNLLQTQARMSLHPRGECDHCQTQGYFLILVVRTPIESNNISEQKDMVKAILGNTLKGRLSLTVKEGESRWTKSEDSFLLHMD